MLSPSAEVFQILVVTRLPDVPYQFSASDNEDGQGY